MFYDTIYRHNQALSPAALCATRQAMIDDIDGFGLVSIPSATASVVTVTPGAT